MRLGVRDLVLSLYPLQAEQSWANCSSFLNLRVPITKVQIIILALLISLEFQKNLARSCALSHRGPLKHVKALCKL